MSILNFYWDIHYKSKRPVFIKSPLPPRIHDPRVPPDLYQFFYIAAIRIADTYPVIRSKISRVRQVHTGFPSSADVFDRAVTGRLCTGTPSASTGRFPCRSGYHWRILDPVVGIGGIGCGFICGSGYRGRHGLKIRVFSAGLLDSCHL